MRRATVMFLALLMANSLGAGPATQPAAYRAGLSGPVGTTGEPRRVRSLVIDRPGVYENILVDAEWGDHDTVRILADGVTLRHCEIRNGRRDGIEVYAADVVIEHCKIHHFLAGSADAPRDAHGITGRPTRLTVRNCEVGHVSGDCLQFDPDREAWTDVVIEHCRLFAGPLPDDAGGYRRGDHPGENALDTKQSPRNGRSRITVRDTVAHGFTTTPRMANRAALNVKDHVEATIERCVFWDNEIALRLRGPAGEHGGAHVAVVDCAFYDVDVALRVEDRPERLDVLRPMFGEGVSRRFRHLPSPPGPGFVIEGAAPAPPREALTTP